MALSRARPEPIIATWNKLEAREVLAVQLTALRQLSYEQLVERLLDREETFDVAGPSGTQYQVELQAFWDARPNDVLHVLVSVDDGGWRAFVPLTDSFLVAPDGSIVGE